MTMNTAASSIDAVAHFRTVTGRNRNALTHVLMNSSSPVEMTYCGRLDMFMKWHVDEPGNADPARVCSDCLRGIAREARRIVDASLRVALDNWNAQKRRS